VTVSTDFTVAGRVAQFGRGLMEDVSKSLVAQMAACIKSQLETAEQPPAAAAETVAPPPARGEASSAAASEPPPAPAQIQYQPSAQAQAAKPVNALGLMWTVLIGRLKRLFSRPAA
jgi:hypothetical protein